MSQPLFYISFNQDKTCISVGTRQGYRIYNCQPFGKCFHETEGGIGVVEMLYSTSLVALVGAGDQPAFSPRRLRLWNTKTQKAICDLNFVTAILAIKMNRQRLVVVLETKIYIFDLNTMQVLETLETSANPKAICALSTSMHPVSYLAFPTITTPGEVLLYDATNLSVINAVQVHKTGVALLAFNSTGTLLATASDTGTIIRVFEMPNGKKKTTFRRGSYRATIYSLAFNPSSTLLCASSDTGTIHIFSLTGSQTTSTGSFGQVSSIVNVGSLASIPSPPTTSVSDSKNSASDAGSYLPNSLSDLVEGTRDFAFARLRSAGVANICAIHGPAPGETIVQLFVATIDGFFYSYHLDVSKGGECRLERENLLRDSTSEAIEATYLVDPSDPSTTTDS